MKEQAFKKILLHEKLLFNQIMSGVSQNIINTPIVPFEGAIINSSVAVFNDAATPETSDTIVFNDAPTLETSDQMVFNDAKTR